jgi:nitrate/nitrite-specific signal transduction histidine kinase
VAKHADARHVEVQLTGDGQRVRMRIHDDGVGLPPEGIDRRTEGHLGLQLVRDAVKDLGGDMRVFTEESGGATVVLDLPSTSVGLVGNTS